MPFAELFTPYKIDIKEEKITVDFRSELPAEIKISRLL